MQQDNRPYLFELEMYGDEPTEPAVYGYHVRCEKSKGQFVCCICSDEDDADAWLIENSINPDTNEKMPLFALDKYRKAKLK